MRTTRIAIALATVSLACFVASAHAEYRCAGAKLNRVDAIACKKAGEDLNELRKFVWNSRAIYALHFYDYVRPEGAGRRAAIAAAAAPAPIAGAAAHSTR